MSSTELQYWIALNKMDVIGAVRFNQLLRFYGSAAIAWADVSPAGLTQLGWGEKTIKRFFAFKKIINPGRELERVIKSGVTVVTMADATYPANLKEIYDPPPILYIRGELSAGDQRSLAVVGSRRMSSYGRQATSSLVAELVKYNLTIVSGLAFGIDAVSHKTALENGGRSLIVLASGVDKATPVSNSHLADQVVQSGKGAVISEFPLGQEPKPFYFPIRNRIISGLSLGVLVVEAAEKSGALITARCALDQGREVFSVPGPIFSSTSKGTAKLIQDGAKLVTSAADVLEELSISKSEPALLLAETTPASPAEACILAAVAAEELFIDEIIRFTSLPAGTVQALLTGLVVKGMVVEVGGGRYRKS